MALSKSEFLLKMAEALNEDPSEVTESVALADLQGWDSVGQLATIALFDEYFQKSVKGSRLRDAKTMSDLIDLDFGDTVN